MNRVRLKLIIIVLSALMGTGTLADSLGKLNACRPGVCCCTPAAMHAMGHDRQETMAAGCRPEAPASCCQIAPLQAKTAPAVPSPGSNLPHRLMAGSVRPMTNPPLSNPFAGAPVPPDTGPPIVMPVPLYLQTLSILC